MLFVDKLKCWLIGSAPCGNSGRLRRRSRSRQMSFAADGLEKRCLLSATNPLPFTSIDGTNGFHLDGTGWSGISVDGAGDVNGDGYDDVIVGAWYFNGRAGASHVVFGKPDGFDASIVLADLDGSDGFRIDGVSGFDYTGKSVSTAGDVNGDGYDDLIVGAYGVPDIVNDNSRSFSGEAYIVFGRSSGFAAAFSLASLDGHNGFRLDGIDPLDSSGTSVSTAGDVNGDGFDDLIIGIRAGAGESYVVFGHAGGFAASFDLSSLDGNNGFRLDGYGSKALAGVSVSGAGDVNGDGFDDLIIEAPGVKAPGSDLREGERYIVFGKADGYDAAFDLSTLNGTNGFRVVGRGSDATYPTKFVSGAGDVNGDGFDDVIIGAPNVFDSDASFVVFGGNFTGGVETRVGGSGNNTLTANRGPDNIDILIGGRGGDTLISDGGADVLRGGQGDDTLVIPDAQFNSTR